MKWLKYIGYFLMGVVILGAISYVMIDKPAPEGTVDEAKTSALRQKMYAALNKQAWEETKWIQWSFPRGHDYLWDKERHLVEVRYDDYTVLLDPETVTGKVFQEGTLIEGPEARAEINTAFSLFTNDAFWLAAPFMLDDPNIDFTIASTKDGREGLLVTYNTGGVTPGDKYLWILDEDGTPNAYQMWVDIIPVGGTEASWEDYITLKSGARVASNHKIGPAAITLTNIQDGTSYRDFGRSEDPFAAIAKKKSQR